MSKALLQTEYLLLLQATFSLQLVHLNMPNCNLTQRMHNAWFPPFHCCFTVPVSRCRFCTSLPLPLCLGSSASMIGWPATEQRQRKNRTRSYCNGRTVMAVTEWNFLTLFFTEQWNFTTAKQQRKTAMEWWKPGIRLTRYHCRTSVKVQNSNERIGSSTLFVSSALFSPASSSSLFSLASSTDRSCK